MESRNSAAGRLCPVPKGEYLQYGGLAVIEGVMMRSPKHMAVACRAPNGEIVTTCEPLEKAWLFRQKWLQLPFLRGSLAILDSLVIGNKALKFAGEVQMDPKYAESSKEEEEKDHPKPPQSEWAAKAAIFIAVAIGLALGFLVFNALPNYLAEASRFMGIKNGTVISYIAESIKVIIFLGYIWGISFMKEIREIFRYHGAEHKAINAMEAEQPLDVDTCLAQSRIHPRCGTSFAIIVLAVGFILNPLVPRYPITGVQGNMWVDVPVRLLLEILVLPIIAGISYEALRYAGKMRNQQWVMAAFAPGMWTQRITTKEPEQKHVEVAIRALEEVLAAEENAKAKTEPAVVPA